MNKADCFHLGYVAKLHGYKGEVSLFLDVSNPEDYEGMDALFIDLNDQLTPFFIENLKIRNKGFVTVKLEGIDSEDAARKIIRKEIYLPAEILPELEGNHFYDHEVIGFKVIDQHFGEVGILENIIDYKVNPLMQVMKDGKEVLLPLIEDLVTKVDREKEEIHVVAPEGLIELYLG